MRTDKGYTLPEFMRWTRGTIYWLIALSVVPALLYQFAGWTWLTIPWGVIFMLGTTVALSAGFKMLQTSNRMLEAQQMWSSIVAASRIWGGLCRDLVDDPAPARELVYRHLAWLAALRHQLRHVMPWETANKAYNAEYARRYHVDEREARLEDDLARFVAPEDAADILSSRSAALEALNLQSRETKRLLGEGKLAPDAIVGAPATGFMIWVGVPLSILVSWMYAALDRVGEATENPFEGGANDVPITRICAEIEADLRGMLGEVEIASRRRRPADIAM